MKNIIILLVFACALQPAALAQLRPLDVNLENYTYPFPVHYITLSIQKGQYKMAYMDVKPTQPNGKSIMLLHGKNFNGAYWKQTAQSLSDAGYRVIIPDQIGFGKSSKPENFQYSFQQLAMNTKSILDTLGISQIIVLGHSMGGMLSVRFSLMYPALVERLILTDPIGLEDYKLMVPYQSVDKRYQVELKQNYDSLKKYEQASYYHGEWKAQYDEPLNAYAGFTLNKDYPLIAWNAALTYDMIMTQPVIYELDKIDMPTLLIIGQSDKSAVGKDLAPKELQATLGNYNALGRESQKKIKGSRLVELKGVGHLPHVEAFDDFINAVKDFLKN